MRWFVLILLTALVLSACQDNNIISEEPIVQEETVVKLKVFASIKRQFMDTYGNLKHPDSSVELDVFEPVGIHDPEQIIAKIAEQKPDIIYLGSLTDGLYQRLVAQGHLLSLDHYMREMQDSDIHPAVLQTVEVDGKIYALPSSMLPMMLAYNKDLFDQNHIPYPTHNMSIEQLFELAGNFSNQTTVTGLNARPIELFMQAARMGYHDEEPGPNIRFSEKTQNMLGKMIHLYRSGAIAFDEESRDNNLFLQGKAAMMFFYGGNDVNGKLQETGIPYETLALQPVYPADLFAITTYSKLSKESWQWIAFIFSHDIYPFEGFVSPRLTRLQQLETFSAIEQMKPEILVKPEEEWPSSLPGLMIEIMNGAIQSDSTEEQAVMEIEQKLQKAIKQ